MAGACKLSHTKSRQNYPSAASHSSPAPLLFDPCVRRNLCVSLSARAAHTNKLQRHRDTCSDRTLSGAPRRAGTSCSMQRLRRPAMLALAQAAATRAAQCGAFFVCRRSRARALQLPVCTSKCAMYSSFTRLVLSLLPRALCLAGAQPTGLEAATLAGCPALLLQHARRISGERVRLCCVQMVPQHGACVRGLGGLGARAPPPARAPARAAPLLANKHQPKKKPKKTRHLGVDLAGPQRRRRREKPTTNELSNWFPILCALGGWQAPHQIQSSSSTSNTSVAFGGITPPAPRAP